MSVLPNQIDVKLAKIEPVNSLVTRFTFERPDGSALPPFSGGSHVVVEMHDAEKVIRNPYSLMSDPADCRNYQISVRRDDDGRGGSLFMHEKTHEGMEMKISYPVNLFNLDLRARKHLMLAGGIGITPFIAQMHQLSKMGANFELHYAVRSESVGAYVQELLQNYPHQTHVYRSDQGESLPLDALLHGQGVGTHLYVCGPKGLIEGAQKIAKAMDWPDEAFHCEEFLAPPRGKAFKVRLAKSGKDIEVGPDQSLLEAIEAAGVEAPYLCRGGACGQCETHVLEIDGRIENNDHWLTDEQREEAKLIMPCVSRFEGKTLVLDR